MPQTFLLGMNAKVYQGPEGTDLASLDEMDNVKDVSLTLEAGEADVTTRANQGWGTPAIKTAFLSSTPLRLAVLTGDVAASGTEGPLGDFSITNFSRDEPLEDAVMTNVTAKLAKFEEWVEVA